MKTKKLSLNKETLGVLDKAQDKESIVAAVGGSGISCGMVCAGMSYVFSCWGGHCFIP